MTQFMTITVISQGARAVAEAPSKTQLSTTLHDTRLARLTSDVIVPANFLLSTDSDNACEL